MVERRRILPGSPRAPTTAPSDREGSPAVESVQGGTPAAQQPKDKVVPLGGSSSPESATTETATVAELADRHLSKALAGFDALGEDREVSVTHFHIADLHLRGLTAACSALDAEGGGGERGAGERKAFEMRQNSALRHARRSAEFWQDKAVSHPKDYLSSHLKVAQLLSLSFPKAGGGGGAGNWREAIGYLVEAEALMRRTREAMGLPQGKDPQDEELFIWPVKKGAAALVESVPPRETKELAKQQVVAPLAVKVLRKEMGRICQQALAKDAGGKDAAALKAAYLAVLKSEPPL